MKKLLKLVVILFILIPIYVKALDFKTTEYGSYDEAKELVKEVMKSYYFKGDDIQYNYSKVKYPIGVPEEATSQDINYSVCAAFTYSVHNQAFGMIVKGTDSYKEFPRYNYDISDNAYAFYKEFIETTDGMKKGDGHFLLYYQHSLNDHSTSCKIENINNDDEKIKYVYGDTNTSSAAGDLETLIDNLRPGDLVVYSGHALIVYDITTNPNTGKKDALILNSTADGYIGTRIEGTSKISYNSIRNKRGKNNLIDLNEEGSIQFIWLSEMKKFVNSAGNLSCQVHECAVIRTFYENESGNAVFNYPIDEAQYKKAQLRKDYSGLVIEKTVDKHDNNSVYLNDELTYTIKVTNMSGAETGKAKTYNSFSIEETLGDYVNYISSTQNGNYNNNKVRWVISSLKNGETITLTYKVKINDELSNVGKIIESRGKFYSSNNSSVYITTGNVDNKIIPKVTSIKKSYKDCYTLNKEKSGLNLIDAVYECAYGIDFNFGDFDINNFFTKTPGAKNSDGTYNLKVRSTIKLNENNISKVVYSMVLNDYLGGLFTLDTIDFYLPRYTTKQITRAKTIYPASFKDGDVLIYNYNTEKDGEEVGTPKTNEQGLYVYIYIDGKFVGLNKNSSVKSGKDTTRNEFTYNYYGSNQARHASDSTCKKNFGLTTGTLCDYRYYLWSNYADGMDKETLDFVNYQTLFDKDNFVILRPELLIKELAKIEVSLPTQTQYIQNSEKLNLSGGTVILKYNDGSEDNISLTDKNVKVTGFDNKKVGKITLTVEYKGLKTNFDVEIIHKSLVDNPDTGIVKYGILIVVAIISIVSFILIRKKSKFLKHD